MDIVKLPEKIEPKVLVSFFDPKTNEVTWSKFLRLEEYDVHIEGRESTIIMRFRGEDIYDNEK